MSSISSSHPHKYLAVDSLIQGFRERFEAIEDSRRSASVGHSLADCPMSAFAMFSLKEPSLLAFDQRRQDKSLMNLYKIKSIPTHTQWLDHLQINASKKAKEKSKAKKAKKKQRDTAFLRGEPDSS